MRVVARRLLPFLLVAGLLVPATAAAQRPSGRDTTQARIVHILRADSSRGNLEAEVHLFGNVLLRQDSTYLRADRVVRYVPERESRFFDQVVITTEGDTLRAQEVIYDERLKVGVARGNVRLSDGDVVVLAPFGRYFVDEDRATFDEGVTLIDSTTTLRSRRGEYLTEAKRAEFVEEVQLFEDRTRLEADSVTFFRETEVAIARGDVFLERIGEGEEPAPSDSLVRTFLFGAYVYNDGPNGISRVRGDSAQAPLLVQLRADSVGAAPDTFAVAAERLETTRQDSLQRLVAVGGVRIWQPDLSAAGDSLVYDRIVRGDSVLHEEVRLFGTPDAWAGRRQLSGDSLRIVRGDGDAADSLFVVGRAFVAEEDSVLRRIQQLQGGRLVAVLGGAGGAGDELRALHVGPNAEIIRFREKDGVGDGAVLASGDTLDLTFAEGEIRKLDLRFGIKSTIYDEALIPPDLQLSGFRWTPERRPAKEDLLDARTRRLFDPSPPGAPLMPPEAPAALPEPATEAAPPDGPPD